MTSEHLVENAQLAERIRSAVCPCGHGILEHHIERCMARLGEESPDPAANLLRVIFGDKCPCDISDAEALARFLSMETEGAHHRTGSPGCALSDPTIERQIAAGLVGPNCWCVNPSGDQE